MSSPPSSHAPSTSTWATTRLISRPELSPTMMGSTHPASHWPDGSVPAALSPSAPITSSLVRKRRASSPLTDDDAPGAHKRLKTDGVDKNGVSDASAIDGRALVSELAEELQCACCAATVYRPVISRPCDHFFCGSCIALWIRNGGTNCPVCRSVSIACTPSRTLERMVTLLLRHDPSHTRAAGERAQANEVYKGGPLTIPPPRESSPPPQIPTSDLVEYARPCPHCIPGNPLRWTCPRPVPDPTEGVEDAWHLDDGPPPDHGWCGNCEDLLALGAPTTTKCDLCQVSFCGLGVPDRCIALPVRDQRPHRFSSATDLYLTADVYDAFEGNTVEVEFLVEHLERLRLSARNVYREIVCHILEDPHGFTPLIEEELFVDVYSVPGGVDPDPSAPRNRICRVCADEVLLWGLRDWWMRERAKGTLGEHVYARPDCIEGGDCIRQNNQAHAKEFNHIIIPPPPPPRLGPSADAAPMFADQHSLVLPPLLSEKRPEPALKEGSTVETTASPFADPFTTMHA